MPVRSETVAVDIPGTLGIKVDRLVERIESRTEQLTKGRDVISVTSTQVAGELGKTRCVLLTVVWREP
jgi:hypothetical protein